MSCVVAFTRGSSWARYRSKASVAIPGPLGSPLLGLLTVFTGATPNRALAKLAKTIKAVKLMAFSVGFARFIVSNDLETARDILDNNNSAFAYRPVKEPAYELLFHRAMGFAVEYWLVLEELEAYLSHPFVQSKRITGFEGFRRETGVKMVEELKCLMEAKGEVLTGRVLHFGSLNNVMATVFGKKYDFEKPGEGFELEGLVSENCAEVAERSKKGFFWFKLD
ncbi:cytochrome P450 78A5-like [Gossypium hirsutum]|uniref:Cytochrome P450 78A5-like n=1 Tax=Gossypium hirsutum TaxID=3635 RepID=A0A1U8JVF6_GOSHI|nr:cytochrome P450 78A5-like [Gossypium hirsutum]